MKQYVKSTVAFLAVCILFLVFFFAFTSAWKAPDDVVTQAENKQGADIYFDTPVGFYTKGIIVKISKNKDCTIFYTTDGNVPGETVNKKDCKIYDGDGIPLRGNKQTTAVCSITARPLYDTGEWGNCIIGTYVVGGNVNERFTNLTAFITCDPDKLYGYENGILVTGKLRDEWQKEHPGESPIPISPAGYNQRGMASEREVNVEFFTPSGVQVINQTVGVRVAGAYTRAEKLKSLKLFARTEYDEVLNKFNYRFFGEKYALDGSGRLITDYKRVLLRSSGSDLNGSHIRDEFHQTLCEMAGVIGAQNIEPVAVFLNGEYYGSMWAHSVISDKWFEDNFGVFNGTMAVASGPEADKPDKRYEIDSIEEEQFFYDDWNEMYNKYSTADLTVEENYEEFCKEVDVDNFLFYYAINTYINNNDWPYNNHKSYRYYAADGEEYQEGTIFDGRWRFLVHDMDWSWGADKDILNRNLLYTGKNARKSMLFQQVMQRADCVEKYVGYCLELMNGAFSTENYIKVLDEMHNARLTELSYFTESSRAKRSLSKIEEAMEENRIYGQNRPKTLISDLRKAFNLSGTKYFVSIDKPQNCYITTGNWEITDSFLGTYLIEYGTKFVCHTFTGYEFLYWDVNGEIIYGKELNLEPKTGTYSIKAVVKETEKPKLCIYEYSSKGSEDYIVLYNPSPTEAISTYGYSLSDSKNKLGKYTLPARIIEPECYLKIYCDNYSGTEKYHRMAVPFNLKEGEKLYLSYRGDIVEKTEILDLHDGYKAVKDTKYDKFLEKIK